MQSVLGVHEHALRLRAQRMEILAANLANADTPRFKARDFDFSAALAKAAAGPAELERTHTRHLSAGDDVRLPLSYRVPFQPSRDGNTVEADMELARFAQSAVAYQASLLFLNGRINGLRLAINGGR